MYQATQTATKQAVCGVDAVERTPLQYLRGWQLMVCSRYPPLTLAGLSKLLAPAAVPRYAILPVELQCAAKQINLPLITADVTHGGYCARSCCHADVQALNPHERYYSLLLMLQDTLQKAADGKLLTQLLQQVLFRSHNIEVLYMSFLLCADIPPWLSSLWLTHY